MSKKSNENQLEITITADTNDADYISQSSKISKSDLELIKPLIKAIKNFTSYTTPLPENIGSGIIKEWEHCHNFPSGECVRDDLGEKSGYQYYLPLVGEDVMNMFEGLLPYGEHGIHTIKSIEVTPYVKKIKLL